MNQRQFTRVEFHLPVEVEMKGQIHTGRVENISMGGMRLYLDTPMKHSEGEVSITVPLTGTSEKMFFEAEIAYANPDSGLYGFHVIRRDIDSFQHLRKVLEVHGVNSDVFHKEIMGLIKENNQGQEPA